MVADRGYAAEQILQSAPEEARIFGNRQLLANGGFAGTVNIARPGPGVGIRASSQARVEVELQMIVGVDQSGQDKMTGPIHAPRGFGRLAQRVVLAVPASEIWLDGSAR